MGQLLLLGLLFVALDHPLPGRGEKTNAPPLKEQIIGKWEYTKSTTGIAMTFAKDGEVTISWRLEGKWHHDKAKYQFLDEATLELIIDLGNGFSKHLVKKKFDVYINKDRLTLKSEGTNIGLERSK